MDNPERCWPDRYRPGEHRIIGCGVLAFTLLWSIMCAVIVLLMTRGQPPADLQGSRTSLALHDVSLFQFPFLYPAVLLGWFAVSQLRRSRMGPTGLARIRRTPEGWLAELPSARGFLLAIGATQLVLFLTAFTPLAILGKRNPLWVWYWAVPMAIIAGIGVYRRWHHRPTIEINDLHRTVTFRPSRRRIVEVPWDAVSKIEVACIESEENRQYDCRVTAGGETMRYSVTYDPEAAERLSQWLRERLGRRTSTPAP